jgi:hypothetical protein
VEPRGFEPLTSAMRGRSERFAAVHYRSNNRLHKPNPRIVSPRMFAIVRAGCRQIVVSCISKYWASKETLFIDRQVYSRPVHVVLEASVQEARERMSGRQQTGSMQDPANGLPRIPLLRCWVNRDFKRAEDRSPAPVALILCLSREPTPSRTGAYPSRSWWWGWARCSGDLCRRGSSSLGRRRSRR